MLKLFWYAEIQMGPCRKGKFLRPLSIRVLQYCESCELVGCVCRVVLLRSYIQAGQEVLYRITNVPVVLQVYGVSTLSWP